MNGPTFLSGATLMPVIRHVEADPGSAVPLDKLLALRPGLAVHVAGRAVVQDAPVDRPRPRPVRRKATVARVGVVPPGHLVALLGEASRVDPAAASRRPVILQLREPVELFAGAERHRPSSILLVRQGVAIDLARQLVRPRRVCQFVRPVQVDDRVGERAALFPVQRLQPVVQPGHDVHVQPCLGWRLLRRPVPLKPAARVAERPFVLGEARGRQLEHLRLDRGGIHVVVLAVVLPEPSRLRLQRVHDDEELHLAERGRHLGAVRERHQRVEPLDDVAGHLALVRHLERAQYVVGWDIELRQPVVGPVVVLRGRLAVHRFLERNEELAVILPVAGLPWPQRLELLGAHVAGEGGLLLRRQVHVAGQQVAHQTEVGQPLDVGMSAQRVHSAAEHADVAEQHLHDGHRTDVLRSLAVLRPAERIQRRHRPVRRGGGRHQLADLQELGLRRPADPLHHLGRVRGHMLLQQLHHAARMLHRRVQHRVAVGADLVLPASPCRSRASLRRTRRTARPGSRSLPSRCRRSWCTPSRTPSAACRCPAGISSARSGTRCPSRAGSDSRCRPPTPCG